jgi:hypothetical protein
MRPPDAAWRRDPALHVLQHALGLDDYGQGESYRNRFVTDEGTDDWPLLIAHVEAGRMVRRDPTVITGGGYCFAVTEAGRRFVREHSPPPPKLTAGQRRYRKYLAADSCLTFGEWLRETAARGGLHA